MSVEWPKNIVEWTKGDTAYLSVVFTWDLPKAHMRAVWYREQGYNVRAGGPACLLMPDYLAEIADVNGPGVAALERHNPNATYTSRGCVRKCKFCSVPKIEGSLVELDDWEIKPIVCDNNLTGCSWRHFSDVIDKLKALHSIDFQGLDARLLTKRHAERLAELNLSVIRMAWDNLKSGPWIGVEHLLAVGIPKSKIRIYVLIGFDDTPEDALYRLETIRDRGFLPIPQRYNPLDALSRDVYVSPNWNDSEIIRYMRYWYNPHVWKVPFEEWEVKDRIKVEEQQMGFAVEE